MDGAVLRSFSVASDRYARGQHRGVDLGAPPGTAVRSACEGKVGFAGRMPGGGLTVSVRCGPLVATYQQLGALAVRAGEVIARGRRLGTVGRSVDAYDPRPHLHLGARDVATGRYVDPLTLLGRGGPVALPIVPEGPGRPSASPLGPAPVSSPRVPEPPRMPVRAPAPDARFAPLVGGPAPARSAPWFVWAGALACGLALPIGGFATFGRRRVSARRRAAANGLPSA